MTKGAFVKRRERQARDWRNNTFRNIRNEMGKFFEEPNGPTLSNLGFDMGEGEKENYKYAKITFSSPYYVNDKAKYWSVIVLQVTVFEPGADPEPIYVQSLNGIHIDKKTFPGTKDGIKGAIAQMKERMKFFADDALKLKPRP